MDEVGATQFLFLLHELPFVGERSIARALRKAAQARHTPAEWAALPSSTWRMDYGLDPRACEILERERDQRLLASAAMARTARAQGLTVLSIAGAAYPERLLKSDSEPPPILYAVGQVGLLLPREARRFTFTVAISNGAPAADLDRGTELASALCAAGGVVVTGHDRLAYQRLALAAQRRGAPCVFVMDRGLREALGPGLDRAPYAAARIREDRFAAERDLALSPFRPGDHSIGANNRRRDRLVFSLSDAVIALNVRAGGSMEAECQRAAEAGRAVFACAGTKWGARPLPEDTDTAAEMVASEMSREQPAGIGASVNQGAAAQKVR